MEYAFDNGVEYGEINFARALLEQICETFEYPCGEEDGVLPANRQPLPSGLLVAVGREIDMIDDDLVGHIEQGRGEVEDGLHARGHENVGDFLTG